MKVLAFAIVCLLFSQVSAKSDCDPREFLVSENINLLQSDTLKLAFLNVATEDQWKRANKGGNISINGIGGLGFQQATDEGKKFAKTVQFNLNKDQSYSLIANKVSAVGAGAYVKCLENDNAPLTAWVAKEAASLVLIKARFRPKTQDFGVKPFALQNFKITSKLPAIFPAQDPQEIAFQRLSCQEAQIEIKIGAASKTLLFPPVAETMSFEEKPFRSSKDADATQPFKVSHAPPDVKEQCDSPPDGFTFVPGSAQLVNLNNTLPQTNRSEIIKADAYTICWRATALSGSEDVLANMKTTITATIRRPKPGSSTCILPSSENLN